MKKIFKLYPDSYYQDKADELFEQGMVEIANGDYAKAYSFFLEAIELFPQDAKYYFFAGLSSYYFQDSNSTNLFKKAAIKNTNDADYQMWYGISLYRDKEYMLAKKVLLFSYSLDDTNDRTIQYLAKVLNRLGEYKQVKEFVELGVGLDRATSEMLYELGYSYMKELKFKESESALIKSIEKDSKNIMSYYFLQKVYLKMGEFDKAIQILNELSIEVPNESELVNSHIESINILRTF